MHLSFCGASREVTGSCYLLETASTRLLIDCGMFQGGASCEAKNFQPFPFDPQTIDAVVLTHAHLDHTGRLPKLFKEGFRGPVYATPPSVPLAKLVVEDAFHIMQEDFKTRQKPLPFEAEHLASALQAFHARDYSHSETIGNLSFRFRDAGHIFGSAFVEVSEKGGGHVTFSGDVGNEHVPILRETAQLAETDALILESTYGNRIHEDESSRVTKLKEVILRTMQRNGVLIIPAFAIERTQQLLFELNRLVEEKKIPAVEVFLDSPMAIHATEIIKQFPQYYDAEAMALVRSGEDFFDFPGLHTCLTRDDSKTVNAAPRPKIIIAGSGMMNGGRILHHLVRYLGDPRSTVLIIGFQAAGTLGRKLYEGEKNVTVMQEQIQVKAEITSIGAYSAHGDQNKLVNWVRNAAKQPSQVLVTHGEEGASVALSTRIQQELAIKSVVPRFGDRIEI
jgi:metallo-beta-lactamase family protein